MLGLDKQVCIYIHSQTQPSSEGAFDNKKLSLFASCCFLMCGNGKALMFPNKTKFAPLYNRLPNAMQCLENKSDKAQIVTVKARTQNVMIFHLYFTK